MNKRGPAKAILIAAMIILVDPSRPVSPASPGRYTISLERLGVAFDLPRGYAVFQRESQAPWYATIISFGREFRPGHLKNTPPQIAFWPTGYDGVRSVPEHKPSQYVDVEFERVKENVRQGVPGLGGPEYVRLLGNKAVRYYAAEGSSGHTVIMGYFRADQLLKGLIIGVPEYLVRIDITEDGHLFLKIDEKNKELIDTVVNSLRFIR